MKKTLMALLLLSVALGIKAQDEDFTQAVGVQLGYGNPIYRINLPYATNPKSLNAISLNGFKVGVVYDATLIKGFGVMMGLNYTYSANQSKWKDYPYADPPQNTKKITNGIYPYEYKFRNELHQLELVVDWQYKFEIARDTWLILYTGPTLQCIVNFGETLYVRSKTDPTSISQEKQIGSLRLSDSDVASEFKRVNVTWGVGAGFQYQRFFLRGGYDFGLFNPYKYDNFNKMNSEFPEINTRGRLDQWQIKLGVYLWSQDY